MATSSITHNFVISTPQGIERFVSAIDAAKKDCPRKKTPLNGVLVTSPSEIQALMKRRVKIAR